MSPANKASLLTMAPLFKQLAEIAEGPSVECAVAGTRKPFDTARPACGPEWDDHEWTSIVATHRCTKCGEER